MRKVAIIGGADSRKSAPFDDSSWDIWSLNNIYPEIPRQNIWFEIHHICQYEEKYYRKGQSEFRGRLIKDYLEDLAKLDCPVFMQNHWPIIPLSIPFPLKSILSKFKTYFTSTIAFMIAWALYEDFDEIGLWGINMAMDGEYYLQRPCLEYFLGIAEGQEKKISISNDSPLLKAKEIYGYDFSEIEFKKEIVKGKIKRGEFHGYQETQE